MPRIVDHDKRKVAILLNALSLFEEKGLADTTLTQIAQRCKIGRPTLYQYFRNKDEIFQYSIKYYTDHMLLHYQKISSKSISPMERLSQIFCSLAQTMADEQFFLRSLVTYYAMLHISGRSKEFHTAIRRRTIFFRRLLLQLLLEAETCHEISKGYAASGVELLMVLSQNIFVQVGVFDRAFDPILEAIINATLEGLTHPHRSIER